MINASQIRDYLKPNGAFAFVGGAGDWANAADQLKASKSLFVLPPSLAASANTTGTDAVRQPALVKFRIIAGFIVRSATREDTSGAVDATRDALMTALIGWTPDAAVYAPTNFAGWQPLASSKDGTTLFFTADFFSRFYLRAIPQ